MMRSASGRAAFLLFVAVAAACNTQPASRTTVDRVLKAPDAPNAPYSNIVLVGVAPSRELARQLEQGLGEHLSKQDVETHSFVKESSAKEVSEEAVQALVTATGADGILMINGRLTGGDIEQRDEPIDVEARPIGDNLLNYFRYEYEEYVAPTYADITLDIVLVSQMFDAASNNRVHSVEANTTGGETGYEIIMAQSAVIVARMKKDGIID
jgi:hypothetical protein